MSRANSDESSPSSSSMKTSSSCAFNSFGNSNSKQTETAVHDNRLPNQQAQKKVNGNNLEFFADFSTANSMFSNPTNFNSIPNNMNQQQETANFQTNVDMNANFADFENNKIYNAVGESIDMIIFVNTINNYTFGSFSRNFESFKLFHK